MIANSVLIKRIYFLLLITGLFAFSYQSPPEVKGDGPSYIEIGDRLSFAGCFASPTEAPPPESSLALKIEISGHQKLDQCFFLMQRPFLFPLLLKVMGLEVFNVFQNLLHALSWVVFSFAIFLLNFKKLALWFLHFSILLYHFLNAEYHNEIGTEDLNMALWLLNFSLLLKILFSDVQKTNLKRLLVLFNLLLFALLYIRDSNFTILCAYSFLLYVFLFFQILKRKHSAPLTPTLLFISTVVSVVLLTSSYLSVNHTLRYANTLNHNMDYHLGGAYWPNKTSSNLFYQGDQEWFFENYPELKTLEAHSLAYRKWQIENIKKVWIHYVLTHIQNFTKIVLSDFVGYPKDNFPFLFAYFFIFSSIFLLLRMQIDFRFLIFFTLFILVIFLDYFIALIGDAPGSLTRHANISKKFIKLLFDFLFCFGLYTTLQLLAFCMKRIQEKKMTAKELIHMIPSFATENQTNVQPIHSDVSIRKKLFVLGTIEWVGLLVFGAYSGGITFAKIYYQQGIEHYYNQQYTQAIEDLTRAITIRKGLRMMSSNVHSWAGLGYAELEKYDLAVENFTIATELDPLNANNYNNLALIHQHIYQNYDKAIDFFSKGIQTNPDFQKNYHDRGALYFSLGKYEQALPDMRRSIQFNPQDVETFFNISQAFFRLHQYESALRAVNKTIELDRNHGKAYNLRGSIYGMLQKYPLACENLVKACQLGVCEIYNNTKEKQICR